MPALVQSGLELMLIGMITVFLFLTLLVGATSFMSRLVIRFEPKILEQQNDSVTDTVGPLPDKQDATLVAVITAAIQQHRSRRKH